MTRPIVHLIPHTHWDREWYLPLGGFRARMVSMIDGLLIQLDAEPRIRSFLLDGQAILLEDYLALRPERREAVARLVAAGRLQTGPWHVLADEQIPAGESLIRNLLLGSRFARSLGAAVPVLYSPDAFGHPAALPRLGREFGLGAAVLWRGVSPEATGGKDLARWRAADGSEVLVYHLPPDGYEIGSNLLAPDERLEAAWRRVATSVLPRRTGGHVALFVGADHHAPDPRLGTLAERLAAVAPDCEFRFSSLAEFFSAVAGEGSKLATFEGEQRWSYGYTWTLQGNHGTRAHLKRRNSALEIALTRLAEPLAALTGVDASAAVLRQAWREVVSAQFHDAICGTAHDAVARAMAVRFDDAQAAVTEVIRAGMERVAGHDPDLARETGSRGGRLIVWNPAARARGGVVMGEVTFFCRDVLVGPPGDRKPRTGKGARRFVLRSTGPDGAEVEVAPQVLALARGLERTDAPRHYPDQDEVDRAWIAFPVPSAIPGFGCRSFEVHDGGGEPLEPFAAADGALIWNGRVEFGLDRDGTGVLRRPGGGRPFTGLFGLESEADLGDTYTFCPRRGDVLRHARRTGRAQVTAAGPLVAGLSWSLRLEAGEGARGKPGNVNATVALDVMGDSPALGCRVSLENSARNHRLRFRFPTGITRTPALAGTAFGVVARQPVRVPRGDFSAETPVRTAPAHRFVAVAKGERGLAFFAPGFFEYEWTSKGDLLVTLLRSVGELSRSDLSTRPGHAGWPTSTPEAQCLGQDELRLGLAAVTALDLAEPERLERMWEELFVPPVVHWIRDYHPAAEPAPDVGLALDGEGLVLSAVKPAEEGRGIIVRCYSLRGAPVTGRLRVGRRLARASLVRADETEIRPLAPSRAGDAVEFPVSAYGLASLRLTLAL